MSIRDKLLAVISLETDNITTEILVDLLIKQFNEQSKQIKLIKYKCLNVNKMLTIILDKLEEKNGRLYND